MRLSILQRRFRYPLILLRELVATDFKLRYQGSVLGYLWSLLRPIGLFGVLYVVFAKVLKIGADIENYAIYLLLGVVLWNFFVEITNGAVGSIVGKGEIIRRLNFHRHVIPIASSISALINLSFNLLVVIVFASLSGVDFTLRLLWFPLILFQLFILALGLVFFLSALFVRYRDVTYIWELLLQGAFYATPVLYPVSLVIAESEMLARALMLNPLAQVIQDARYSVVSTEATTTASVFNNDLARLGPIILTVLIFILGLIYFTRHAKYFAEEV